MTVIPVFKPQLPKTSEVLPYLSQIETNQWYTNYGPLVRAFEARLAKMCGVSAESVVTSCNGTMALVQTLLAVVNQNTVKEGYCITPSWTFVATPAAIQAAGLSPYFADVSPGNWALDPHSIEELVTRLRYRGHQVAAVVPVAPFGAPLDLSAWEIFQQRTKVPVVVDAAASFDHYSRVGAACAPVSTLPVVISLHATKVFGIGEGAFILTADHDLAGYIRSWGNFGFCGSRQAQVAGLNTKMAEMPAAVGLALLDIWAEVRSEWLTLAKNFRQRADSLAFLAPVPDGKDQWVSSYGLVRFADPSINLSVLMDRMLDQHVETRRWWTSGCHRQPAYVDCEHEKIDETEKVANTVLGLPFWRGLADDDMARVFTVLAEVAAMALIEPQARRSNATHAKKTGSTIL